MEESFAWKIVYLATLFSLFVLGIAYLIISPYESPYYREEKTDKIVQFHNCQIEGRKDGKISWRLTASSGWTQKDQDLTHLSNISRGSIYDKNNRLILRELLAPKAIFYRKTEVIEASGPLTAYLDFNRLSGKPAKKSAWSKLRANYLKYIPAEKKSEISDKVILVKKDAVFETKSMAIDHEAKTVAFNDPLTIKRQKATIDAGHSIYFYEKEELAVSQKLQVTVKDGKIVTMVRSNQGTIFLDQEKDVLFSGSVEATQNKKLASGAEGYYSRQANELLLRGKTHTVFEKVTHLIKRETLKRLQSEEEKNILKEKTIVSADEIFFSTKTGDARASGSVEVTQNGKVARSDNMTFDEKNELLTLTGTVYMKKDNYWIKCRQVLVSINKETFEAVGVAEGRFKL